MHLGTATCEGAGLHVRVFASPERVPRPLLPLTHSSPPDASARPLERAHAAGCGGNGVRTDSTPQAVPELALARSLETASLPGHSVVLPRELTEKNSR